MKIIGDGDCYNQVWYHGFGADRSEVYSLREPDEIHVLNTINGCHFPMLQFVNFYLMKIDAGWLATHGESVEYLQYNCGFKYYEYVSWVLDEYLNNRFSWQREKGE